MAVQAVAAVVLQQPPQGPPHPAVSAGLRLAWTPGTRPTAGVACEGRVPPHSAPPPLHPHPVGVAAAGCSAAAWRPACWPAWLTTAASPAPAPAAHRPAAAGRQATCRAREAHVVIGMQALELGKQQPWSSAAPTHCNKQRPRRCGLGPATHGVTPSWRCRIRSSARRCAYRCHLVLCSTGCRRVRATVAHSHLASWRSHRQAMGKRCDAEQHSSGRYLTALTYAPPAAP